MRSSLFIKLFLGFWLVSIVTVASGIFAAQYFDKMPSAAPPHPRADQSPRRFILQLLYDVQNLPLNQLEDKIATIEQQNHLEIYLLDANKQPLFGNTAPQSVIDLASQLDRQRRRAARKSPQGHMRAHLVYRQDEGLIRLVVFAPRGKPSVLKALRDNFALRLVLALAVSGLLSYALSRFITRRIHRLRIASRQFSDGNLDTRIPLRHWGRDETDDLAADFNTMADKLQQQIEAQHRLLGDISHELRSPLARLRVALALAQSEGGQTPAHLQRIEQETEHLESLISQLLASNVTDPARNDHIDLAALLEQLCVDASFEGNPRDISANLDNNCEQALVTVNAELIKRCFQNLLRNALQHSPANGKITVKLYCKSHHYYVEVRDQGPGVAESELGKIFGEFYRVDTARTRETGGYGLGLAIASRAIAVHQGKLSAENTDSGLVVTVCLPATNTELSD